MRGAMEAARLLDEAHALLVMEASPAAEMAGWLRLQAVLRGPAGPEPVLRDDRDALALAEIETAGAAA